MHLLVNLVSASYKWSILSHFGVTLLVNNTYYNRVILIHFVQIAGGHLCSHLTISFMENNDSVQPIFVERSRFWVLQYFVCSIAFPNKHTSVGTLIVATIYLQLIQNRYMLRSLLSFTVVTSIVYNPLPAMWKS